MKTIIKRDGRVQKFDRNKIIDAVLAAFKDVDNGSVDDYAIEKAGNIADYISDIAEEKTLTIEEIQDYVEKGLMSTKRKDVAKSYILFREKRNIERTKKTELRKAVIKKLMADEVLNQNANVDEHSFGGRMGEANEVQTKDIALNEIVSKKSRENHLNNEIYIHDLGSYAVGNPNCLSIPFDDLLANGFNTRQTDIRPANSISTAFQLLAVIFQLQSLQQFGGVSATHLDWTMVPYVRKSFWKHYRDGVVYCENDGTDSEIFTMKKTDGERSIYNEFWGNSFPKAYKYAIDMTEKEIQQSVEGMYHNLNTLQSRSGNQLPFTSINYGTCTLPEGRMVIKALLEGSLKGVGKLHKTPIFPCGIFQCMKGVNRAEGEPNYDLYQLALKSTAKRLYPNYANVDWSGNAGYDINDPRTYFSTMGCRTANGWDINGFGQLKDGRGNICPVTIILPTLAMIAKERTNNLPVYKKLDDDNEEKIKENIRQFISLLDKKIYEAKDMLIERFEWICSQNPASAKFVYENNVMAGYVPEEGIRSALKHGTLAIGQIGLAETLQILIGCDHTTEKGMSLAKKIEQLFRTRCDEFKEEYKLNFGVYYTPAENLCYTAMQKFKKEYGVIPNVSDRDYFTNSIHVPVWKKLSPFDKIDIEGQLTGYSSAGCITYVELEEDIKDHIYVLDAIVSYAMDHDIPYFAVNVPNDTCLDCGYCGYIPEDECPICKSNKIQRLRRVTGYLTGDYKTAFNPGKRQEAEQRVKHYSKIDLMEFENHKKL